MIGFGPDRVPPDYRHGGVDPRVGLGHLPPGALHRQKMAEQSTHLQNAHGRPPIHAPIHQGTQRQITNNHSSNPMGNPMGTGGGIHGKNPKQAQAQVQVQHQQRQQAVVHGHQHHHHHHHHAVNANGNGGFGSGSIGMTASAMNHHHQQQQQQQPRPAVVQESASVAASSRRSSAVSQPNYIQGSWERVTGERMYRPPSAVEIPPEPRIMSDETPAHRKNSGRVGGLPQPQPDGVVYDWNQGDQTGGHVGGGNDEGFNRTFVRETTPSDAGGGSRRGSGISVGSGQYGGTVAPQVQVQPQVPASVPIWARHRGNAGAGGGGHQQPPPQRSAVNGTTAASAAGAHQPGRAFDDADRSAIDEYRASRRAGSRISAAATATATANANTHGRAMAIPDIASSIGGSTGSSSVNSRAASPRGADGNTNGNNASLNLSGTHGNATSALVLDYQDRVRTLERDLASRDREISMLSHRCRAAESDAQMLGAEVRRLRNRLIAVSAHGGVGQSAAGALAVEAEDTPGGQLEMLQRKIKESMDMIRVMHEEFDDHSK